MHTSESRPEVVGQLVTFCLHFCEYCEFRHASFVTLFFRQLYSREICDFGCNCSVNALLIGEGRILIFCQFGELAKWRVAGNCGMCIWAGSSFNFHIDKSKEPPHLATVLFSTHSLSHVNNFFRCFWWALNVRSCFSHHTSTQYSTFKTFCLSAETVCSLRFVCVNRHICAGNSL